MKDRLFSLVACDDGIVFRNGPIDMFLNPAEVPQILEALANAKKAYDKRIRGSENVHIDIPWKR